MTLNALRLIAVLGVEEDGMCITELVKRLGEIKSRIGDMVVEVRNPAGDFNEASAVELVSLPQESVVTRWRVFIDA
jgi:hypothetical protein